MDAVEPQFPKSDTQRQQPAALGPSEPNFFKSWNAVLPASSLTPAVHSSHRAAIITFLKRCRDARCPAAVTGIKCYLHELELGGGMIAETTEALRWFYRQDTLNLNERNPGQVADLSFIRSGFLRNL